jgi:hypothetical protein
MLCGSSCNLSQPAPLAFCKAGGEKMTDLSKIKEHMDVFDSTGKNIGQVDHLEGKDKIKLTKNSSPDGHHHFVPVAWIDHIDTHVHLKKPVNDVSALQMAS